MELNYIVLTFLLLSTASCFNGNRQRRDDDDDDESVDLASLKMQMLQNSIKMRNILDEKIAELKDTVEAVNVPKLDHITEVVESIRRTQKFIMVCTEGLCGDNGTCDVSADLESFECHCDEGYVGEHCEITGPCNVDRYNVNQLPLMLGREIPNCAEDGSYAGMQYMGSQAYCVTVDNTEIIGYSVNRWETGDMNCQCARDELSHTTSGTGEEKAFNCLPNGNYPQVVCDASECWCQDWQGQRYGEPVPAGELDIQPQC